MYGCLKIKACDKKIEDKLRSKKLKKGKRKCLKGLKVHISSRLSEQLKGKLRKRIKLSLMRHGLLLLLGLLVKNFTITSE
jgi:hypothetical protein